MEGVTNEQKGVVNKDIIIRSLKQPTCISAKEDGNLINLEIEKELGIEIIGDTKVKISSVDEEETWDNLDEPQKNDNIDKVIEKIEERDRTGSRFTIIAVAEGAISKKDAKLSKKEYKEKMKKYPYPSVSYEIAAKIQEKTGREVRVTVPGHMQRGGSPCPYDRVFASRLGSEAGKLILDNEYGFMVGYKNREIVRVPLEDVAGKLKTVSPDATIVQEAKLLGISFGD